MIMDMYMYHVSYHVSLPDFRGARFSNLRPLSPAILRSLNGWGLMNLKGGKGFLVTVMKGAESEGERVASTTRHTPQEARI